MGISLGWVVFFVAGMTGAPPAERGASQISYTVKMVEAEGVGWREAVFTHLKPVTRQGSATVWTLPKNASASLIKEICKSPAGAVVAAPRVTAFSGVPAAIQVRGNRTFVTQVAWNGDEIGAKGTPEAVRVGWHATMVGRALDQGILVKLVIEDTEIRGVHKVSVNLPPEVKVTKSDVLDSAIAQRKAKITRLPSPAPEGSPFEAAGSWADEAKKIEMSLSTNNAPEAAGSWADEAKKIEMSLSTNNAPGVSPDALKKAKLNDLMGKALTAYAEGKYIECEALASRAMEIDPKELAASMLVYKAKAERRFKVLKSGHDASVRQVAKIEGTCEGASEPSCDSCTGTEVAACDAPKEAIELPEIANQEVLGEWLIPKGECLLVSFGPHTVADKDGKAVVKERLAIVEADEQAGVRAIAHRAMTATPRYGTPAPPMPIAPSAVYGAPMPEAPAAPTADFRPTPPSSFDQVLPRARYMRDDLQYLAPAPGAPSVIGQAGTQPTRPQEKNPDVPARIASVPAAIAPVAPAAKMPAVPDRSIPQGVHTDGTKAKLPPLPDDEMEDYSSDSESAEPMPSPQSKKTAKPKPAGDEGTTKASFTQPKSSTVFLPSMFLPGSSTGFQFLMPLKPFSLRLPFSQRLEIEIFGRVVPDTRVAEATSKPEE